MKFAITFAFSLLLLGCAVRPWEPGRSPEQDDSGRGQLLCRPRFVARINGTAESFSQAKVTLSSGGSFFRAKKIDQNGRVTAQITISMPGLLS